MLQQEWFKPLKKVVAFAACDWKARWWNMSSGCRSQQEDEFLVLQSIYGEESVERTLDHCITVHVPDISTEPKLILSLTLPEDYPAASHPIVEIHSNLLDSEAIGELAGLLEELYTPGKNGRSSFNLHSSQPTCPHPKSPATFKIGRWTTKCIWIFIYNTITM